MKAIVLLLLLAAPDGGSDDASKIIKFSNTIDDLYEQKYPYTYTFLRIEGSVTTDGQTWVCDKMRCSKKTKTCVYAECHPATESKK